MKKVFFLINTLDCGGAEHVLIDIINGLDKNKFDVTIKTIYNDSMYDAQLKPYIHYETFTKYSKKSYKISKIVRKIINYVVLHFSPKILYKIFVNGKYDIEVAFLEGIPTKIISGSNSSSKKIAWVHTDIINNKDSLVYFKTDNNERIAYNKFDEIYCVSEFATNAFKNRFKILKNVYTVNNIINEENILLLSKKNNDVKFNKNFINIVTVGRLEKVKAFDRLINCFYNIKNKIIYPVNIYIIGAGSQFENLHSLIKSKNLDKEIFLLGYQNNPYKFMKEADFYICCSHVEGSSLTIKEALTLNKPFLTTDCGIDLKNIQNKKYGIIVDNFDKNIENGLLEMINNPKLVKKMSDNIKNNYVNKDNIKKIEDFLLK